MTRRATAVQRTEGLRWALLPIFVVAASGCLNLNFTERSEIQYTRAIAMVVDPPVFRPGDVVTARGLVVRPDGSNVRPDGTVAIAPNGTRSCDGTSCFDWSVCVTPEQDPGLDSTQYNPEVPTQGCDGTQSIGGSDPSSLIEVSPDGAARIDTSPFRDLLDPSLLGPFAAALGLPASVIEEVIQRAGLPVRIQLRVFDGDDVFISYKRVLLIDDGCSGSACPGANPPAPEVVVVGGGATTDRPCFTGRQTLEPFSCHAGTLDPDTGDCLLNDTPELMLEPSKSYVLAPLEDGASWLERYEVLGLDGNFIEAEEQGFFSWFTSKGALQEGRTRFPAAEEIFTTPQEVGTYALWVVVRDGHYGASACRLPVTVSE